MTTTNEIREMFLKNIREFKRENVVHEKHEKVEKADKPEKREPSVNITDICVYTCMCPRQVYYNKVAKRQPLERSLIRFNIGNYIHDIPINKEGYEVPFEYEGIRCRMDDIDVNNGWIADKKTVSSFPLKAKDYPTKQLNMYKVIAEENKEKSFKVNNLFVVNINIINGEVQVLDVPIWTAEETKKFMFDTREIIRSNIKNKLLPTSKSGWWCDSCQYTDLCEKNATEDSISEEKCGSSTLNDY